MTPEERANEFALKVACSSSVEPGIRKAILEHIRAALRERDAQTLDKVLGVLAHARAHYSEEIFEADGVSLECCQARWARNLLGGIMDDIRALLKEEL